MEQANLLLQSAMLVASSHGSSPAIVLAKSDPLTLQRVLESSSWSDAFGSFAHLPSTSERIHGPFPIHFPTHESWITRSSGSRLDHILINNAAKCLAVDAWTTPRRIPGGHLPLFLQLMFCPHPFDVPPSPKVADSAFLAEENEAREAANTCHEEVVFYEAIARLDTQESLPLFGQYLQPKPRPWRRQSTTFKRIVIL